MDRLSFAASALLGSFGQRPQVPGPSSPAPTHGTRAFTHPGLSLPGQLSSSTQLLLDHRLSGRPQGGRSPQLRSPQDGGSASGRRPRTLRLAGSSGQTEGSNDAGPQVSAGPSLLPSTLHTWAQRAFCPVSSSHRPALMAGAAAALTSSNCRLLSRGEGFFLRQRSGCRSGRFREDLSFPGCAGPVTAKCGDVLPAMWGHRLPPSQGLRLLYAGFVTYSQSTQYY